MKKGVGSKLLVVRVLEEIFGGNKRRIRICLLISWGGNKIGIYG